MQAHQLSLVLSMLSHMSCCAVLCHVVLCNGCLQRLDTSLEAPYKSSLPLAFLTCCAVLLLCCCVQRLDNSLEDFSYRKCLSTLFPGT